MEGKQTPLVEKLGNGFGPGSALYTEMTIGEACDTFSVNLQCGKLGAASNDISLHFNPRLNSNYIVLNSYDSSSFVLEAIERCSLRRALNPWMITSWFCLSFMAGFFLKSIKRILYICYI